MRGTKTTLTLLVHNTNYNAVWISSRINTSRFLPHKPGAIAYAAGTIMSMVIERWFIVLIWFSLVRVIFV